MAERRDQRPQPAHARRNTPGSYCLVMAAGINSHGEIAGMAVDQSTGNTLGFSAIPSANPGAGNQGCSNAQNATATNTPNALSRALARQVHRLTELGTLDGAALGPTVLGGAR